MHATFAPPKAHDRSAAPLEDLLNPRQCAFFFDVDGTLIDIAIHPDAVSVPKSLLDTLDILDRETGGALALVSGRPVAGLDALFSPLRLAASGVHGAEVRLSPDAETARQSPALAEGLRGAVAALARDLEGVLVEDKGSSIALHYRLNPEIGPRLRETLAGFVAADAGLALLPGRLVFELKHAGHDKGSAVRQFMQTPAFAGRTPVFMGDDVTDEAAFAVIKDMGGIVISVGRDFPDADVVLPEAQDVRALLDTIAANSRRA
ncbi:trehalose-phosphatase [Azorhizobium doebereinerae]|uniref:trehalose-phosphatase n=1 Tax=Azorhizobium doebereinerae TaxID=281091 RepID=UPI00068739C7|nr:trehalose-phosphatase [Azorhizobium doebereinerae]